MSDKNPRCSPDNGNEREALRELLRLFKGDFLSDDETIEGIYQEIASGAQTTAGLKLVPLEPTQDMLDSVSSSDDFEPWAEKLSREVYQEMVNAAPNPPPEAAELIAQLQYEAGMYKSLYSNLKKAGVAQSGGLLAKFFEDCYRDAPLAVSSWLAQHGAAAQATAFRDALEDIATFCMDDVARKRAQDALDGVPVTSTDRQPTENKMTEDQIKHMVDRFLYWKLPKDFSPDCGISFDANAAKKLNPGNGTHEPVGTNLFTAAQADAMVRFMIEGLPLSHTERQPNDD